MIMDFGEALRALGETILEALVVLSPFLLILFAAWVVEGLS